MKTTWTGHLPKEYVALCNKLAEQLGVDRDKIYALADRAWRNGFERGADMFGGDASDADPNWEWSDPDE